MTGNADKSKVPSTIIDWAVFKSERAEVPAPAVTPKNAFQGKNKRRALRSPVSVPVKIWLDSGVVLEGCSTDISLTGVSFSCANYLPVGNPVRIEIYSEDPATTLGFKLCGNIVRIHEEGLAVAFAQLQPAQLIALDTFICSCQTSGNRG